MYIAVGKLFVAKYVDLETSRALCVKSLYLDDFFFIYTPERKFSRSNTSYKTYVVFIPGRNLNRHQIDSKEKKGRELYPAGYGCLPRKTIHFYMNSLTVGDLKVSYFA